MAGDPGRDSGGRHRRVTHAKFTLSLRVVGEFPSLLAYGEVVAEHKATARRIGETEWDVVCRGCPGHDAQVGAVRDSPPLTCKEQAQLLADFHDQIYSELGDTILR